MTGASELGGVYTLGNHRLFCGDARDWQILGDDPGFGCVVFDPPWDQNVDLLSGWLPESLSVIAFTDAQRFGDVIDQFGAPTWVFTWDTAAPWSQGPTRPLKQTKHALWYGDLSTYDREAAMWGEPPAAKNHPTTKFTPDPRGRRLTDLYRQSLRWLHHPGATGAVGRHPHEKPLDWVRCLIGNCSSGIVFDPFAGSGTSLIAAELLGRESWHCEINPAYCDAIRARWEQMHATPDLRALSLFGEGAA